jgi:basic membrane protein A
MSRLAAIAVVGAVLLAFLSGGASGSSRQLRVALVTDIIVPAGSHDLRVAAYRGFLRGVKDFGVQGRVVQSSPTQGMGATLASLGRQGYDLIFTAIPNSEQEFQAIGVVAKRFPRSRFILIDGLVQGLKIRPKNVQGSIWRSEQPAYLAGYLAALIEKRRPGKDVIGSVGGAAVPPVDTLIAGYEAGAKRADPGITILRGYAQDFLDPAKCKAASRRQLAKGAGAIFNVAGACGLGTLQAAKEKGVWGIGVDVDQSYLGPHILTSVLKGANGQDVYLRIKALVQGKLRTGGNAVWDLRNGAVGLGKISPKVPRALVQKVEAIRKQIVASKIRCRPGSRNDEALHRTRGRRHGSARPLEWGRIRQPAAVQDCVRHRCRRSAEPSRSQRCRAPGLRASREAIRRPGSCRPVRSQARRRTNAHVSRPPELRPRSHG